MLLCALGTASKYSNHVLGTENAKLGSYPTAEPGEPWISQKKQTKKKQPRGHLQINLRWLCVQMEELLGRSVNSAL